MEFHKITNFLDTAFDYKDLPRVVTKTWIEVHDQSEENCSVNEEIRIKTSMLRSDLCDFSDAYIVVKGTITLEGDSDAKKRNKNVAFKDNAPLIKRISKINSVQIDNAEDLDVVMPIIIYFNTVEITEKQQTACGTIIEMNQVLLFLLILNLLNTRQVL